MMAATVSVSDLQRQFADNPDAFYGGGAGLEIPFEWTAAYGGSMSWPGFSAGSSQATEVNQMGGFDITKAIQQGVQTAAQIFSRAPSGGSDFLVKAYPSMLRQAQSTGIPVDAYWFGDIVRVIPSGPYGAISSQPTLTDAEKFWTVQAQNTQFFILRCGGQGTALMSGCRFDLMGANKPVAGATGQGATNPIQTAGLATNNLALVILVGFAVVAGYLMWGKK
jgi:hypothetical protein